MTIVLVSIYMEIVQYDDDEEEEEEVTADCGYTEFHINADDKHFGDREWPSGFVLFQVVNAFVLRKGVDEEAVL